MRLWSWLLVVMLAARAEAGEWWTPVPTATPRPTPRATVTPRPTATPTRAALTPTPTPRPSPTAAPTVTPTPAGLREYVFLPSIPVLTPDPGDSLRFADGTEFIVLVRHASIGEVPYRLVRVR